MIAHLVSEHPVGVTDFSTVGIGRVNHTAVGGTREGHAGGNVFELEGRCRCSHRWRQRHKVQRRRQLQKRPHTQHWGQSWHRGSTRNHRSTVVAVEVDTERNQEVVTGGSEDFSRSPSAGA